MILEDKPDPEHLMEFMYHAAIGVVHTDISGHTRMLNPVAVQLLMPLAQQRDRLDNLFVTLEPFVSDLPLMVAHAGQRLGMLIDRHRIALPTGLRGRSEPVYLSLSIVKVAADCLVATLEDVSVAVRHERLLGQQEAWVNASHVRTAQHCLVLLDETGTIAGWNPAMQALTGFNEQRMVGHSYGALFAEDAITPDRVRDRLEEVDRSGLSIAEGKMKRADGSVFWGHSVIVRVEPSLGTRGFSLLVRDISGHRETIESLLKAATSDQLTGVANRRALFDAAEVEFARFARKPRAITMLLLDIDHFKQINDTYGHPVGDQVIRNLADVLVRSVRSIDIVARIGGEEFAVLLPSTDLEMATRIAERIRARIASQQVTAGQAILTYQVSVGIAQVTPHMRGIDDLIMAADEALYDAKHQGRNRVSVRT